MISYIQCHYKTQTIVFLDKHNQALHRAQGFICKECYFQTLHKGSLTRHRQLIHESWYIKARVILVIHVIQENECWKLTRHKKSIHVGNKCICNTSDHQATSKGNLTKHRLLIHGGKKYPWDACDYYANRKGDLTRHSELIHKGKKYPCDTCDHQATSRGNLTTHRQIIHERKKLSLWLVWPSGIIKSEPNYAKPVNTWRQ